MPNAAAPLRKADAARRIRQIAKAGVAVEFTDHADRAMADDDLTRADVLRALQSCRVAERTFDVEHNEWK